MYVIVVCCMLYVLNARLSDASKGYILT